MKFLLTVTAPLIFWKTVWMKKNVVAYKIETLKKLRSTRCFDLAGLVSVSTQVGALQILYTKKHIISSMCAQTDDTHW